MTQLLCRGSGHSGTLPEWTLGRHICDDPTAASGRSPASGLRVASRSPLPRRAVCRGGSARVLPVRSKSWPRIRMSPCQNALRPWRRFGRGPWWRASSAAPSVYRGGSRGAGAKTPTASIAGCTRASCVATDRGWAKARYPRERDRVGGSTNGVGRTTTGGRKEVVSAALSLRDTPSSRPRSGAVARLRPRAGRGRFRARSHGARSPARDERSAPPAAR